MNFIDKENRLLRPKNLFEPAPGRGFEVYKSKKLQGGSFKFNGKCFYEKCDDVFKISKDF